MKQLFFISTLVISFSLAFGEAAAQHHLLVLNKSDNTVWQLDAQTGEKVAEYTTGVGPHEVAVSPDRRLAVVTNYGGVTPGNSLTVINLADKKITRTIDLDPYQRPHGVQWFSDGERVIVTVEAQKAVITVDVGNSEILSSIKTDQLVTHMVTLNEDNTRAFATSIGSGSATILNLEQHSVVGHIATGAGTEGLALLEGAGELWVTNRGDNTVAVIDTKTLEIVTKLESSSFPIRATRSPDGTLVAVSNGQSHDVTVFDVASREKIATVSTLTGDLSEGVPIGMVFSDDGSRLYVSNSEANQVVVIDTGEWEVLGTFKTGDTPDGIAYF